MSEDDVKHFLESNQEVLKRAIAEIEQQVGFFVADWGKICGFAVERIENARIKDVRRVLAKARRKELSDADGLLRRCDEQEGRRRFPVQDLLGVRVLVRSLNDAAAVKRTLENLRAARRELYPLGNPDDFDVEDMNVDPRPSGYRALHIDGSVTVRVADRDVTVPFELQVKTLAQHVFGQHTHEEAYVPNEANGDPRYELVRVLQTALAEQLNTVDLLLAKLEDVASAVRDDIARRGAGLDFDGGERGKRGVNAGAPTPAALESFEHFQAQPVGRGGRAELRASGETHANAIPGTPSQLTMKDLQIVRLVAEGLANKEVAAPRPTR
jgi:ppGpp synthetase/RelA/SpoT-type nucleotidyltranferase